MIYVVKENCGKLGGLWYLGDEEESDCCSTTLKAATRFDVSRAYWHVCRLTHLNPDNEYYMVPVRSK